MISQNGESTSGDLSELFVKLQPQLRVGQEGEESTGSFSQSAGCGLPVEEYYYITNTVQVTSLISSGDLQ